MKIKFSRLKQAMAEPQPPPPQPPIVVYLIRMTRLLRWTLDDNNAWANNFNGLVQGFG